MLEYINMTNCRCGLRERKQEIPGKPSHQLDPEQGYNKEIVVVKEKEVMKRTTSRGYYNMFAIDPTHGKHNIVLIIHL